MIIAVLLVACGFAPHEGAYGLPLAGLADSCPATETFSSWYWHAGGDFGFDVANVDPGVSFQFDVQSQYTSGSLPCVLDEFSFECEMEPDVSALSRIEVLAGGTWESPTEGLLWWTILRSCAVDEDECAANGASSCGMAWHFRLEAED